MTYAAVVSLSHTIDLLLNNHQHSSISPKLKNQMISLHTNAIFLESFLEESPQKVNFWEEEVIIQGTDIAEAIIELLSSDSLMGSNVESSQPKFEKGEGRFPYGLDELRKVAEQIDSIVNRLKGESMDHGSDYELMKIISLLRGGSSKLERIAIYGAEGMGQTILARSVYNNPLIVEQFGIRAWFNASTVSYSGEALIQSLYDKRYLIVIDDLRSYEVLNWVKKNLPCHRNGSRIILTTSLFNFVKSVDHFHKMGLEDEDRAWNLLRKKIFKGGHCPPQLESIGKMIARRCRRKSIAIDVVSRILAAADQTEAAWEDISENMDIAYEDGSSTTRDKVLTLSYKFLPHHLRPCLLYLGIFPIGKEIRVSELVKLWVAEGFLNESECKSFEETGEEHLEDLVRRHLVSVCRRKSDGRIKTVKIENHMWYFCLRQARTDNFFLHGHKFDSVDRHELQSCKRVSSCTYDDNFLEGVYGSTIRTIMLYWYNSRMGVKFSIGNVRLLRVLDLRYAFGYELDEEVFELFHLRYLAFHCGFNISEAISNLQNLQTLIICSSEKEFEKFGRLPEGIWRMPQLRHLIVFPFELPCLKQATSALENLQTFSGVVDFICSRENLKMIPNLKKVATFYSNNSRDVVDDYELHNLISLQKLEILKIEMNRSSFMEAEHKMSLCAFPPTLKKLNLCGMQLPWEDMKIVASLPNLEVLKLRNHACIGETWETSEGGFSRLTYLLIEESDLMNWITESSHFPSLKSLVLYCCSHLSEVPNAMGNIPTLKLIEMDGQNYSLLCSAKKIEKDRQSLGDYTLHVTCKGKYVI